MTFIKDTLTQSKHDPRLIAQVGLSSMPQPQVSDDHTPLLHNRLTWTSLLPSLLKQVLLDASASSLAVLAFLIIDGGVAVRAEPYLGAAILRRHGYKRHIDDEREGDVRVVEIGIVVRGLRSRW